METSWWLRGDYLENCNCDVVCPFAPDALALAVGDEGSTWADCGLSWDSSGKNAYFAAISWSNT
jgi:hypothetical protein